MGGRYLVTGVQLGIIKGSAPHDPDLVIKEVERIEKDQYIGESSIDVIEDVKTLTTPD